MKDKNLPDDIETKSLEELNNLVNKIINNLEKKSLEDFVQEYQELIKLNNYIEKKFHQESKYNFRLEHRKLDQYRIELKCVRGFVQQLCSME